MADIANSEFVSWLVDLRDSEQYRILRGMMQEQAALLTNAVMYSNVERTFDRGKAVGIDWCVGLVDETINQFLKTQGTDQDTTDT